MRTAIIDMGTNTFHLLVAEWQNRDYNIVHRERIAVRIGAGGISQDMITDEGMTRALQAITNFKKKAEGLNANDILAFGTSALRNAKNGVEVISKIKEATSIKTKIISGDEEAQYIYEGVRMALRLGMEKSLIIDIGGGSVEFIIGNNDQIFWKQSFEIGAQRLLEKFQNHDPILLSEIEKLNGYFNESLKPLFKAMQIHQPKTLVGSSGTFDTLSEIYCIQSGIEQTDSPETKLSISGFKKIYPLIIAKNRSQRMQIPGMIEMRVEMIVVASCLIKFILEQFDFNQIRVSSFSLKEGVLASLMQNKTL